MRGFDENNNLINFDVKENDYKKGLDIDKKKLILIILNKQNREEEIAYLLNENGYDILIADNHEEAIALTIKTLIRPNLIIIGEFDFDRLIVNESFAREKYMMSDQFATYLREIDMPTLKVNEIPILYCDSLDFFYECLDAYDDYDDYLILPFYKKDLLLKIKKLISNNSFEEGKKIKSQEKSIFRDTYSINSLLELDYDEQDKIKKQKYIKTEKEKDNKIREFIYGFYSGMAIPIIFIDWQISALLFGIISVLILFSDVPKKKLFTRYDDEFEFEFDDDDEFEFDDDDNDV